MKNKKEYDSKSYLYDQYCIKNRSTVDIANEYGIDPRSIGYRLKKFGISVKSLSDASPHRRINPYEFDGDKDILYGSLLGDGSLSRKGKNGLASFQKKNVNYDHVFYVGQYILGSDPTTRIKPMDNGKYRTSFRFSTLSSKKLLEEYDRWYVGKIEEGTKRKIVPRDLTLTPKVLLHWFLDDGCCKGSYPYLDVSFSTESFTLDDCDFLIKLFSDIKMLATTQKSHGGYGHIIHVWKRSLERFFDYIGDCPTEIPSMKYKFKLGR